MTFAACGTLARYKWGCRCDACRAANAAYVREQRRLAPLRPDRIVPLSLIVEKNKRIDYLSRQRSYWKREAIAARERVAATRRQLAEAERLVRQLNRKREQIARVAA